MPEPTVGCNQGYIFLKDSRDLTIDIETSPPKNVRNTLLLFKSQISDELDIRKQKWVALGDQLVSSALYIGPRAQHISLSELDGGPHIGCKMVIFTEASAGENLSSTSV